MIKLVGPIFSRIIEHKNCQWTKCKGPQGFPTSVVQSIWSFFVVPKKSRTNFSKIKLSSRRKQRFWPIFSPITHYDRHWVFFLLSSTGYLDNHGANYNIFSLGPKSCLKHIFSEKNQPFQWRNVFALYLFELSSVANLRKRFVRAKKIF